MSAKWRLIAASHGGRLLPARLVIIAEGYAMVRRKGAMPFVVTERTWQNAPTCDPE